MKAVSTKLRVLLIFVLTFFSTVSFSQIDKEFWFSVPYVNKNHGIDIQSVPSMLETNMGGGKPIYLRLSTLSAPATVTINTPANQNGLDTVITIAANSSATIDLTAYSSLLEVSQTYSTILNGPENKGIHILSTASITAYYENATIPNPEIFTLKGVNALGKEFYTPFQTSWPNDPLHNYQKKEYFTKIYAPDHWKTLSKWSVPDSAFSAFDIVATEDSTVVTITPNTNVVGHKKGETFNVVLKKGQTYSVRQLDQAISSLGDFGPSKNDKTKNVYRAVGTDREDNNLSGSHVVSNKPIAISVKDDSIFPNDITESGDCEDYIGDQIIPVNVIGKEYFVMKGFLAKKGDNGSELTDYIYVVGVKDGTSLYIDEVKYSAGINMGQTLKFPVTSNMHITSSENIYVFHISGYNCEFASAVLPPINNCSGSNEVGFVRTYADWNQEKMFINVLVRKGNKWEKAFKSDPDNNTIANVINKANFVDLVNSDWKYAQVSFTNAEMPKKAYKLYNDSTYFHIGLIYSTAYAWAYTWDDASTDSTQIPSLQGASYGYFSNFSKVLPKAIIGNNSKKVIQVPVGIPVQLIAQGGYKYNWLGAKYNDVTLTYDGMPAPYYLNKTSGYNPIFDGTAPVGKYRYTAEIVPACDNKYVDTVLIEVIPPIAFNDVTDSICEDAPAGSKIGVGYNLNNLTDTIVGTVGKNVGYTVSKWISIKQAGLQNMDDAEANKNLTYSNNVLCTVKQSIANTVTSGLNTSAICNSITNTTANNPVYSFDANLPSPVTLSSGLSINMLARPDISAATGWLTGITPITVTMTLTNGTDNVVATQTFTSASWLGNLWQQMVFDFPANTNGVEYNKLKLTWGTAGVWAPMTYYFDNINWYMPKHSVTISPSTKYTVHDNDTVFAVITNPSLPYFSDTAQVIIGVHATGKASKNITLPAQCANSGAALTCVDLTQYKYAVGGALVAQKDWYLDAALTQKIVPATCVDVTGNTTFYSKILDKCGNHGSVTFNVIAIPEVQDTIVTLCSDASGTGNSASGVKLDLYKKSILPFGGPSPEWYSDAALTQLINGANGISVTDKQIFYAKIFNNVQCYSTAKLQFNITPAAKVTINNVDVCKNGGKITLTATPSNGKFFVDGVAITGYVFDPKTSTLGKHQISYEVDVNGCKTLGLATLEVLSIPSVTVIAPDEVVVNTSVQLDSKVVNGTAPYSYEWWPAANLTTSNTISNPKTENLLSDMTFCLNIIDANKCASQKCKIITVKNSPLTVEILPIANTVCLGDVINLESSVTGGTDPYQIAWTSTPAGFTSALQNPSFTPTVTGDVTFTITVTDNDGTIQSATKTISVLSKPSITFPTLTPSVCQNGKLTLIPTISGDDSKATYTWTGSPVVSPSPTSGKSITIDASQAAGPYPVIFTVQNSTGCKDSKIVTTTINANPTATVDAIPGACLGISKQLNAIPKGGKLPYTHLWTGNFSAGELLNPSDEDPIFKSNSFGIYALTYKVTDANKCSATASMTFELNALPEPNILAAEKDSVCQNSNSYLLSSEVKNPKYALNTYIYSWSSKDIANPFASSVQNPILDISKPKTFDLKLQVTDKNGCFAYDSTILFVNPKPIAQIVGNLSICEGIDLPLASFEKSTNYSYSWIGDVTPKTGTNVMFNASTPGLYTVILEVKNTLTGCVSDSITKIKVNPHPIVDLTDTSVCLNTTFTLKPKFTPLGTTNSYTWTIDTQTLNNSSVLNPNFTADTQKDYKLGLLVKEDGCEGSDSMTVHVMQNPIANAGDSILALNSIPFNLNGSATSGTSPYKYLWSPASLITSSTSDQKPTALLEKYQDFYLTVTDINGCHSIDTVFVNVTNDKPEVIIDAKHVCDPQIITLSAHPKGGLGTGYTYKWYKLPDLTTELGTSVDLTVNVSDPETIFRVEMTNSPYAMVFDTAKVYVHTSPTANIFPSDANVCLGQTLQLQADNAALTYVWHDGTPLTTAGSSYLFTNSASSGISNLILDISDKYCISHKTIPVTVNALPNVSIAPQGESICSGNTLLLTATALPSTATYTYAWFEDPSSIVKGNSNTYLFTSDKSGPYTMKVEVTDASTNCKASALDPISVNKLPDYSLPKDLSACTGQPLVLDVNPLNAPVNLTVTWSGIDTQFLVDKTDQTAPIFKADIPGDFTITYKVDDGTGCPRTESVAITVFPAPKISTPDTLIVCQDQKLDIEATVLGDNPSIHWDGFVTLDKKNPLLVHFNAYTLPKTYSVIATASLNEYCISNSKTTVIVLPKPKSNPGYYADVPQGAQVDLVGSAEYGYGKAPYSGKWTPSENIAAVVSGTSGFEAQTAHLISKSYTMWLIVTDANGCIDSNWTTIKVTNGIEPFIPEDHDPKNPYDPNTPLGPNDDPNHKLNYNGVDDVCAGQSITLYTQFKTPGSGSYSYEWTADNSPNVLSTKANFTVQPETNSPLGKIVYKLTVIDNKYPTIKIEPVTFIVYIHSNPIATIDVLPATDLFVLQQIKVTGVPQNSIGGSAKFVRHLWTGDSLYLVDPKVQSTIFKTIQPGDYSLNYTVIDNYGCTATATKLLKINPYQEIVFDTVSIECEGQTQSYEIGNVDNGDLYQWTVSDPSIKIISKNPNVSQTKVHIIWSKPGVYKVKVQDITQAIPKTAKEFTVTVYPAIHLKEAISGPKDVCEYERAKYSLDTSIVKSAFILWNVESGMDKIVGSATNSTVNIQWAQAGHEVIKVIAKNRACEDQITYPVTVHKIPTANFYVRPVDSLIDKNMYVDKLNDFDNKSYLDNIQQIDDKNLQYYWDFVGDGVFVEESFEPKYSYDVAGTFYPTLIAVDPIWGCRDSSTDTVIIKINPKCGIKYPNAFTPEAKVDNNFTYGYSEGIVDKDYSLRIFNRWGQLLWETTNRFEKWDGTYRGALCKQDVYVYHSTATCENGQVLKINGDVTLIK